MTTITRERVAEIIHAAGLEPCDYEEVFGSIKTGEIVAMARIALASLEAEPVLYAAEETLAYAKMGELHLTCLSEPMGDAVIPLYTAPPAPVVNAEYGDAYQGAREDLSIWKSRALEAEDRVRELEQINDHLVKEEQGESRMGESVIREPAPVVPEKMSYQDGVVFVLNNGMSSIERGTVARRAWNACRAAMLQGSQPVSDELPLDYLQGHKDGLEWAAQLAEANHPQTGDWLYDDPVELAKAIRKGPDMPELKSVPADADDNFYSWFGRFWSENYQQNNYTTSAKQMLGTMAEFAFRAGRESATQAGNSPVIPDGCVVVPKRLTAENFAKAALSGEFSETKFINCPECFGDDECETCDGSGRIEIKVPVSWNNIKAIWDKGIEHFSSAAPQQEVK